MKDNVCVRRGYLKGVLRDFPGSPVIGASPSNVGSARSIPGRGAGIPHASRPKGREQRQYCNKFNKDFEKKWSTSKERIFRRSAQEGLSYKVS